MELINLDHFPDRGFSQANLRSEMIHIELIQTSSSITLEDVLENAPAKSRVSGFFKMGLALKDFQTTIDRLKTQGVKFAGSVVKDPLSGRRMVIILDPDGNRVQFFESASQP